MGCPSGHCGGKFSAFGVVSVVEVGTFFPGGDNGGGIRQGDGDSGRRAGDMCGVWDTRGTDDATLRVSSRGDTCGNADPVRNPHHSSCWLITSPHPALFLFTSLHPGG